MSQQAIAFLHEELKKLNRRLRDAEATIEVLKSRLETLERVPMALASQQLVDEVIKIDPSVAEEVSKKTAPVKAKKKPKKDV